MRDSTRDLTPNLHCVGVSQLGLQLAMIRHVVDQREDSESLGSGRWQKRSRRTQHSKLAGYFDVNEIAAVDRTTVQNLGPEFA